MKHRLGIARRLNRAFKHQIAGAFEGEAVEGRGHRGVSRIAGVLTIDHSGHPLHDLGDAGLGHDAVMQPVGDVLRRDAAGCPVFHQAHVVDVGHLRAAHALIDPAHHITEDALCIVLEFGVQVGFAPGGGGGKRNREDVGQLGPRPALHDLGLARKDIDLVIVGGMQGGSGWARHPGAVGTGLRMADLLLQHRMHQVGHGPHALADLGAP